MTKFIWHNDQWVEAVRAPRVSLAPAIHRDTMSVGWHPGTGKATESKSTWRRMNRETGYQELGNDVLTRRAPQSVSPITDADVAEAYQMVEQGYRPDPTPGLFEGDFADAQTSVYS